MRVDARERHPGHRAERRHRREQQELPPDLETDVGARHGLDPRAGGQRHEAGEPRAHPAIEFADGEAIQGVVPDHPRGRDLSVDHDDGAHDLPRAVAASHDLPGVDPVLEAHDGGLRADHRRDGGRRGLHVVELRPEEHEVDDADRRRARRSPRRARSGGHRAGSGPRARGRGSPPGARRARRRSPRRRPPPGAPRCSRRWRRTPSPRASWPSPRRLRAAAAAAGRASSPG